MSLHTNSRSAAGRSVCQCIHSHTRDSFFRTPGNIRGRPFHTSPSHKRMTRMKRNMMEWLHGPGRAFRHPLPASTNYLGAYDKFGELQRTRKTPSEASLRPGESRGQAQDEGEGSEKSKQRIKIQDRDTLPKESLKDLKPFPLNTAFRSESVLSEEMREQVYNQVVVRKMDVASVSAAYGIDIRRVAAVVRLKTIEKKWLEEGKKLAKPYNDAVLAMLPKTPMRDENGNIHSHESINDLPVHQSTRQQIFWPVSESRQFNRKDAASVFERGLLPADDRIPHKELIEMEKWNLQGLAREDRLKLMRAKDAETRKEKEEKDRKTKEWESRTQRVVPGRRWDFKFQDVSVSVESVGKNGRARGGIGHRYGMPHDDRKKGLSKITQAVE